MYYASLGAEPIVGLPPDWDPDPTPGMQVVDAQAASWQIDDRLLERLEDLGMTGKNSGIINLDTGYRPHERLPTPQHSKNFTGGGSSVLDRHGHGNHTIGSNVGRGGISYAPEGEIAVGKVLGDSGSGGNTTSGVYWAAEVARKDRRFKILSCSWGGGQRSTYADPALRACEDEYLWVFFSAGNSGRGRNTVISPADSAHAVAVGAHDRNFNRSSFSSTGPEVAISAGGSQIVSCGLRGTDLRTMSGTSMSCPSAASVALLLRNAMERLGMVIPKTTKDLEAWLGSEDFLKDAGEVGRDPEFGHGIITMENVLQWIEERLTIWV